MKKYLKVYQKVKNDIIGGVYPKGSKLPSKRVMASLSGVSVISVEHAYELLISEGYAESKERSGYYAAYSEGGFFLAENQSPTRSITHAKAENEGLSFDKLAKITRGVLNAYGEELLIRSENKGASILRRAIKNYLQRNKGITVDIERIVVGAGAEYLYGLIIQLLGNVKYAVESPTYEQIEKIYNCRQVNYISLPIGVNGIMSDVLFNTNAKVLHTTPFKNYPTGVYADVNKKAEYLKWAEKFDAFIIEDDYESEFAPGGHISETLFSMDKSDRVIYVNSFSQTIARSMRVGYMILPEKLVNAFDERLSFYSCPVPTLEQYIVATVLSDGTFETHVNKIRRRRKLSSEKAKR